MEPMSEIVDFKQKIWLVISWINKKHFYSKMNLFFINNLRGWSNLDQFEA